MTKLIPIVGAGLLLGACFSVSAAHIDEAVKDRCRAIPGLDGYNSIEIVRACKEWMEAEPGSGDPYYYYGRVMLDALNVELAKELFRKGAEKGSRLSEDAHWFSSQGSLIGGLTRLSGETLEYFQAQAELGNPVGEVIMGIQITHYGQGISTDEGRQRVVGLYKSASDSGDPVGTYLLGASMVYDSNPENDGEGVRLLRVAAEQGVGVAYDDLVLLGEMDESPVDYFNTRYRSASPVDLVMRRP